jgi:hypothetical protein
MCDGWNAAVVNELVLFLLQALSLFETCSMKLSTILQKGELRAKCARM